ncbi:hypothetical protein BKG89_09640 [Rodentibacter caecimuris]|uniref:Uncharacterized protein n=2 Tax=Rodentibacter caecimuris TaxID=1796644 RepID=A0ABX3KVP7_9PAST|nr:hypothetical protein BKG89_09640 [Rodentibacter heylii]
MKKFFTLLIISAIGATIVFLQGSETSETADDGKTNFVVNLVEKYSPTDARQLSAWYDKNVVYADNPTMEKISFKLDGQEIILAPNSTKKLIIEPGKHTLVLQEGKTIEFNQKEKTNRSILNPTGSNYIFWNINYGDILPVPPKQNHFIYNGEEFNGPFDLKNDYFIIRQGDYPWRFGLDEQIPDSIFITDNASSSKYALVFTKAFRLPDFIKFYPILIEE